MEDHEYVPSEASPTQQGSTSEVAGGPASTLAAQDDDSSTDHLKRVTKSDDSGQDEDDDDDDECNLSITPGFPGWPAQEVRREPSLSSTDSDDDLGEEKYSVKWARKVARRAEKEARDYPEGDTNALVLGALEPGTRSRSFEAVLRSRARRPQQVSQMLLASMTLASEGRIIIEQPSPLSMGFKMRAANPGNGKQDMDKDLPPPTQ